MSLQRPGAGSSTGSRPSNVRTVYDEDAKIPFATVPSTIDLCHVEAGDVDRLISLIRSAGLGELRLVAVDTISRALAGGNENAPDDMGALVSSLDRIRDELRCHVLAVHHLGKDASKGSRGHTLLHCAVDTEILIEFDEQSGVRTATITKQRDGETGASIPFRLRQVELGLNLDGDPVTSCIVGPTGSRASGALGGWLINSRLDRGFSNAPTAGGSIR